MNTSTRHLLLGMVTGAVLLAGGLGAGAVARATGERPAVPVTEALPASRNGDQAITGPMSFSPLVKAVKPAVVNISVKGHRSGPRRGPGEAAPFRGFPQGSPFDEFFREHFGFRGPFSGPGGRSPGGPQMPSAPAPEFRAVGSGFIISPEGLVVTNHHVIDSADEIEVVLQDGGRYPATVRGRDAKTDLALLKVDVDAPLPFVELGSSEETEVGDWVVAVGNPFGLGGTVTAGIVSARGRDIQAGPFDDFLQVDAPINRGNSGGPLFDARGRVIGINTAIYSPSGGSVGIGFAIPSEMAADVIDQLRESGVVERGWLGIEFQPVTDDVAASLGLDGARGALVAGVVPDGPAGKAGLRMGDVILSLNGETLDEPKDLPRLVASRKAGSEVELKVLRNGRERSVDVEIGRSESETRLAAAPDATDKPASLGVALAELTPDIRARYGFRDAEGVLVTGVQQDSPAARAGIRPGQIITMVGQRMVETPGQVAKEVEKAVQDGRPSVLFMVEQRGGRRFVAVELAA